MQIPISKVLFGKEEEEQVLRVLRSGVIAQGPVVQLLEETFAEKYNAKNVIAVNNGTTALVAALTGHGIGEGDEVITSPFTFAATLNAILAVGAKPIFADINIADFNINTELVRGLITAKTKAIMPVHLYGQCADMTQLSQIANSYGLNVIQDAAQSQGATHHGQFAGSTHTATFSLYATKNMTTGEGGLISTDNDSVAEKIRTLRNQGMKSRYDYVAVGHNWRLTDLQAAVGIPQLNKYEQNVTARSLNARHYLESLGELPGLVLPKESLGNTHVWHQFTVRVSEKSPITREEFIAEMSARGIGTGIYYPKAVYDYPPYKNHPHVGSINCPNAELAASQVVSIPVHHHLLEEELHYISKNIIEVMSK